MRPIALEALHIAQPCTASWEDMTGDERVRHCGLCKLNVYNLSGMTRADATALLEAHEGRVCVRLLRRADGTVVTQDCVDRLASARRSGVSSFAVALALTGALFAAACGVGAGQDSEATAEEPAVEQPLTETRGEPMIMGKIAAPDPRPMMGAPLPTTDTSSVGR